MMQTLLADRFKLELHRETKEVNAMVLTVAKGGHKLKPVETDEPPNFKTGKLNLTGKGATMAQLIAFLSRELRNKFSRSQSQSEEDVDLKEAEPLFSSPNDRWLLPSSEGQYRKAIAHVDGYLVRLGKNDPNGAQFYARADSLADYLDVVSTRLGSLSQRLSASVGQLRLEGDAPVDPAAPKNSSGQQIVKTPWSKIDDVFYESRGYSWALLAQLKAIEVDFAPILRSKNATVSLKQVIRELEEAQKPVRSPWISNGGPFGFFANHSLVMANYVSRANAALIDLKSLLDRG